MTHRIRIAAALGVTLGAVLAGPAMASGPSPSQPAERALAQGQAHRAAVQGQEQYLAPILSVDARYRVGRCVDGPMVWRCPLKLRASDTACRATVLVWKSADGAIYAEDHNLRCRAA